MGSRRTPAADERNHADGQEDANDNGDQHGVRSLRPRGASVCALLHRREAANAAQLTHDHCLPAVPHAVTHDHRCRAVGRGSVAVRTVRPSLG
jgi:hypothetical protein